MSGMDDRAKQFRTAAEAQLTGPALKKEINTLRRFLFRNQEYRFTKAAQQSLYMAVLAHCNNTASHDPACLPSAAPVASPSAASSSGPASLSHATPKMTSSTDTADRQLDDEQEPADDSGAEAPIIRLLEDALKMPFTIFASSQKDKLLSVYWSVLGTEPPSGSGGSGSGPAPAVTHTLSLMDIVEVAKNKASLSLFTDDGEEYAQEVVVTDLAVIKQLKVEFDKGSSVVVTVQESSSGAGYVGFAVEAE